MKSKLITGCMALGAAAWLTGCGDDNMSSAPAANPPKPAAAPAAPAPPPPAPVAEAAKPVVAETQKAVEAVKPQVQEAAKVVQQAASDAGAAAQQKLTEVVAEVKKLVADGKGAEALQKIQSGLAGLRLSPEQQKIVDDLKKQVQDALSKKGAEAATKAVGDLLKPK